MNIDFLIDDFYIRFKEGLTNINQSFIQDKSLKDSLKKECVDFLEKDLELGELDWYLFYSVNNFYSKNVLPSKQKTEYICPACLYLGKFTVVDEKYILSCKECTSCLKSEVEPSIVKLLKMFYKHNRSGYSCNGCNRFLPQPLFNEKDVSCPYFDCSFVGSHSFLKKKHHPTIKDFKNIPAISTNATIMVSDSLQSKINLLNSILSSQKEAVPYNSSNFTINHKIAVYTAFEELLLKFPKEMIEYLLDGSRTGGFQHKIFQKYISILESSLPIYFKKNNQSYKIDNLLDENLCLFDGVSKFEEIVNSKGEVKNNTSEYYIGGRKASYHKPYYIGKLLDITDHTSQSIIDNVVEYSFSKIQLKNIDEGTKVKVTHLRIPPHYQMGGMVYVNRIKKKITDEASSLDKM